MRKYIRTKLKIHLKKGLDMETYSTPIIRFAIAFMIICLGLAFTTPFIYAIKWW